jgi:uncharacterized membrane protein YidH (DUF202 family)
MLLPRLVITAVSLPASHKVILANERTFLSWLRLSMVLSIVGVGLFSTVMSIDL